MANTAQPAGGTIPQRSYEGVQPTSVTGWAGWIVFAACILFLLGLFHAIAGVVALVRDEYYAVGSNGLVLSVDYTTWGWIHLLGGGVICAAALGLLLGQVWARVVAVLLAVVSAVTNVAFLAANPIWSTIMIAFSVLVIWAVIVHGSELREA